MGCCYSKVNNENSKKQKESNMVPLQKKIEHVDEDKAKLNTAILCKDLI